MRFLIDENLSPRICALLIAGGYHATHIRDHGMVSASDRHVLAKAAAEGLTLITADRGDFGRELRSPALSSHQWSSCANFPILTQPTVSKHLKVLRGAGLVEVRQDAQRRWYRLRPEPLAEIDVWLAPYRRIWSSAEYRVSRSSLEGRSRSVAVR